MSKISKEVWSAVNTLKDWIQDSHVTLNIISFKKNEYTYFETDEENLDILSTDFRKVYNSDVNIDWIILSEIKQNQFSRLLTLRYNLMNSTLQ